MWKSSRFIEYNDKWMSSLTKSHFQCSSLTVGESDSFKLRAASAAFKCETSPINWLQFVFLINSQSAN